MKKMTIMIILLLLGTVSLMFPQSTEEIYSEGIKTLKQADNFMDFSNYISAAGLFERGLNVEPENNLLKYHKAYCNYKISYIYLMKKDTPNFTKNMDEAVNLLKEVIKTDGTNSEAMALLATCYGIKITSDWSLAQSLGAESHKLLEMALSISPNNPRVLLQSGISKFNTPEFFGGDKKKATEIFKQCIELFKSEKNDKYGWGQLDSYAWFGIALTSLKDPGAAVTVYNEALQIEPNFGWIKYKLLPEVQKSLSTNN